MKENFISIKDLNGVARIHSNSKYDMQFQLLDEKNELIKETYVPLEKLETLLSESGYMCFGHGTGRSGNSNEVVDLIFNNGLRTKDNSLYFTTIGLSTPTPELKSQYKELGLPEPSIEDLKKQFNNWQHQDSKTIIIARIPTEYINQMGDRSDRDGEMFGAFYIQEMQPNGEIINYLNPKFIIGCFDVEKQAVRLNKNFEITLSQTTIEQLKERYKLALQKTKERVDRTNSNLHLLQQKISVSDNQENVVSLFDSYDSFDFPEIEWKKIQSVGKSR